jgi:hypothetical protein
MLAWSLPAILAAYSGKTFLEIPALEKGGHRAPDNRAPETVLALKPFVVGLLERVKMLVDQTPQIGGTRIIDHRSALVPVVQYGQFGTRGNHEENALSGSQVGNRQAPGTSIPSMVDRPMATAWKYTCQIVNARTCLVASETSSRHTWL